jgi:hypothetical protein
MRTTFFILWPLWWRCFGRSRLTGVSCLQNCGRLLENMKQFSILFCIGLVAFLGCSTSHVIVGNTRTATDPRKIKVYVNPPKKYETIAVVSSDSNGSFRFGAQGKVDAALKRAKSDAAKLGANGLLLQTLGESGGMMVGSGVTTGANTTVVGAYGGGLVKTVSVLAIFVTEE